MSFTVSSLNFSNAKAGLAEGLKAIAQGKRECDLKALAQVDSASLAVFLAWQRAAEQSHSSLRFINAPESLISLASLYGVSDLLVLS